MPLLSKSFNYIKNLTKKNSGMLLEEEKEYLVESRLLPLARANGCENLDEFILNLSKSFEYSKVHAEVVEALTVNETFFFRDAQCFAALKNHIIPDFFKINKAKKTIRIWSAAASTGQEAYSVAMLLKENWGHLHDWRFQIFGTDLSKDAIERARAGEYTESEVSRGLNPYLLSKYFVKSGNLWAISPELKDKVTFVPMNLCEDFNYMQKFDIIFLRNVLIYFDQEMKKQVCHKMKSCLYDEGYLLLGTGESAFRIDTSWVPESFSGYTAFHMEKKAGVLAL